MIHQFQTVVSFLLWADSATAGLGCLGAGVGWATIAGLLLAFFGCTPRGIEPSGISLCGVTSSFWILSLSTVCGLGTAWSAPGGLRCLYGSWLSSPFEKCSVSCIGDLSSIVGEIGVVFLSIDGGTFVSVTGICLGLVGEVAEGALTGALTVGFTGAGSAALESVLFSNISRNCEKGTIGMGISSFGFSLFLNLSLGKDILAGDMGAFSGVIGSLGPRKNLALGGVTRVLMTTGFCCKGDWQADEEMLGG